MSIEFFRQEYWSGFSFFLLQGIKDAGFNLIRTSHNPTTRAFLDACDSIGMLVIGEAFDVRVHGGVMPRADGKDLPDALKQNYQAVLTQIQAPYMKYFLALDMRPLLGSVTCPVLALNGTKDTQVAYETNLGALRSGLTANAKNKITAVEGLNHLFQHCATGQFSEYREIEETFAPEVLEMITKWVSAL